MFYETPQFIKEEAKFFGFISFTQLGLLMGVLAIIFLLLFSSWPRFLIFFLMLIIVPSGLYIIFGELNGIKIYRLVPVIIRHFFLPKHYLWHKENIASFYQPRKTQSIKQISIDNQPSKKNLDPETVKKLSQLLDQ